MERLDRVASGREHSNDLAEKLYFDRVAIPQFQVVVPDATTAVSDQNSPSVKVGPTCVG